MKISLRVWPVRADCLRNKLGSYGKAYGFDPTIVEQLYQGRGGDVVGGGEPAAVPESIMAFTQFMCDRHVPAEALANSWATERPLSDIEMLLSHQCQQPLFNAAFLGIANPPRPPSPENVTAAYVKKALDDIAPRMEQLKTAGLLHRGYIYAFDESHEDYADALRLLFGEAKRRWPEVTTLSVLNWVSVMHHQLQLHDSVCRCRSYY